MQSQWSVQQTSVPPLTPSLFRIIVVFVTAYIVQIAGEFFFNAPTSLLALTFGSSFHPAQILTHIFLVTPSGLWGTIHLLFMCIILWGFGAEIEKLWGSYHFLRYFYVGLLGGILTQASVSFFPPLRSISYSGFDAGLAAVMVGYTILWPERRVLFFFVIPMKIKWFMLVLLVFLILGNPLTVIPYSGGALAGALFLLHYARKGRLSDTSYRNDYTDYLSGSSGWTQSEQKASLKERYKEYKRKKRLAKKQAEIDRRIKMKEEVDHLLSKISKEGIASLSRKEKAFLDRSSKEF